MAQICIVLVVAAVIVQFYFWMHNTYQIIITESFMNTPVGL